MFCLLAVVTEGGHAAQWALVGTGSLLAFAVSLTRVPPVSSVCGT
jgi:hypothetical protein